MSEVHSFSVSVEWYRCDKCARYYAVEACIEIEKHGCPVCTLARVGWLERDLTDVRAGRETAWKHAARALATAGTLRRKLAELKAAKAKRGVK